MSGTVAVVGGDPRITLLLWELAWQAFLENLLRELFIR